MTFEYYLWVQCVAFLGVGVDNEAVGNGNNNMNSSGTNDHSTNQWDCGFGSTGSWPHCECQESANWIGYYENQPGDIIYLMLQFDRPNCREFAGKQVGNEVQWLLFFGMSSCWGLPVGTGPYKQHVFNIVCQCYLNINFWSYLWKGQQIWAKNNVHTRLALNI